MVDQVRAVLDVESARKPDERVVDEINNQKQDMVIRAVRKMKERAQACVAVGGGVFEGRKL